MKTFGTTPRNLILTGNYVHAWLIQFDWKTGLTQYLTDALRNIVWSGHTYSGAGSMLSIGDIVSSDGLEMQRTQISLSGVPVSMLALAMDPDAVGGVCWVRRAILDTNYQVKEDPVLEYKGTIDAPNIQYDLTESGSATAIVGVDIESPQYRGSQVNMMRNTDSDQQRRHPGDRYCQYTAAVMKQVFAFPGKEYFQ